MEVKILNQCSTNCSLLRESPAALSCAENGAALPDTELSPIEYSTLNTGESPNAAVECTLSQILEADAPTSYYLSKRALNGILTRASRRGKPLPGLLLTAINGMIAWWEQQTA